MTNILELKQFEVNAVVGGVNWTSVAAKAGVALGAATIFTKLCSPLVTVASESIPTGGDIVPVSTILTPNVLALAVKSTIVYLLIEDLFSVVDYWKK